MLLGAHGMYYVVVVKSVVWHSGVGALQSEIKVAFLLGGSHVWFKF